MRRLRTGRRSIAVALLLPTAVACSAGGAATGRSSASGGAATGGGSGTAAGGAGGTGTGGSLFTTTSGTTTSGSGGGGGESPCGPLDAGAAPSELCDNGIDDDKNGFIDESCACTPGVKQACYPGLGGACECKVGQQVCVAAGEFGQWGPCQGAEPQCVGPLDPSCELCGNGKDDDCDGQIDEDCVLDVKVDIDGDCVTATCPPQAPYPIGCNIVMSGGDERGCVANSPGSSVVYFQEGDKCGAGHVSGTLTCSSLPGPPLGEANCAINKPVKYYPPNQSGCPDT
ncbi:MAG: hypothetical protein HY744_17070 [Deltaproteobacteria bacterium]|nr:hypothetical protein [Deltaproteobacteria bacterium]